VESLSTILKTYNSVSLPWTYLFSTRRNARIKLANHELTKMMIIYISENFPLNKELIKNIKTGLASRHNIAIFDIYSLERILQESHSVLVANNTYQLSQLHHFYYHLPRMHEHLIKIDYNATKPTLSRKKVLIDFSITFSLITFFVFICTGLQLAINGKFPPLFSFDMFISVAILLFCSFIGTSSVYFLQKIMQEIRLYF